MKKLLKAVIASTLFICILVVIYLIHIRFFKVDVVFYSALTDVILATIITSTILFSLKYFSNFSWFENIQMLVIFLLMGYAFAISVPTVIDRSLSFYILEKLDQRGGGIKLKQFTDVFTKEYLHEHRLVDVRLTEQQNSGTIHIHNGCVTLTPKGKKIAAFSRHFRQNFLPKQRLLMGEYTDDLTNPFRNSQKTVDYQCNE